MEVTLEKVTKKFGEVIAVEDLTLEIKDKEFMVLLGPSGCGKTTTLRMIAGLESPDSGAIYIGDRQVNDLPPKDRNVAMVFQSYAIYPYMSVFDNIAFPLKIRKTPKEEIAERVNNVAALLEIQTLLNRKPKELSGGQRQRVALGRAIIRNPDIFLMDEPLSNLDAKLRVHMRAELKKLHEKVKATTVYVTHDQLEAMSMGDRIAIMDNGLLQQVGTPSSIYNNPKNAFIGGFIGSPAMNMFEGATETRKDGKLTVDFGSFQLELSDETKETLEKAQTTDLTLGVRPEDIDIVKRPKKEAIKAKVEVIEPVGRELQVHLSAGEASIIVITTPSQDLSAGETVWLLPNKEKAHLFDSKTGMIIL
jgi:multiple sugar transport system ATP-binding protein